MDNMSMDKQMKINFSIHYNTQFGQQVAIIFKENEIEEQIVRLSYIKDGIWSEQIQFDPGDKAPLEYRYLVVDDHDNVIDQEWAVYRQLKPEDLSSAGTIHIKDTWRPENHLENSFHKSAFSDILFHPEVKENKTAEADTETKNVRFQITAPRIEPGQKICLIVNQSDNGRWVPGGPIILDAESFPIWKTDLYLPSKSKVEYRYGIYDTNENSIKYLENGKPRKLENWAEQSKDLTILSDQFLEVPSEAWKGAGVAIPVFSLRSEKSFGVGAFTDIKVLVDWSNQVGLKLVQILPINDTSATFTWVDSYPYAAISVFALHPIYLDLEVLPGFNAAVDQESYRTIQQSLNALPEVDYEAVLKHKLTFAREIFDAEKETLMKSADFKDFVNTNQGWLEPYGLFCALRDQYGTVDFNQWGPYADYEKAMAKGLANPESDLYETLQFSYFLQFYLDKQLREVADYARENRVVLKGDIPIGIYRYSVDAWTLPHLFHMDGQSGAPPDPFSDLGQNWGFPTYNWSEMAKDDYHWWQSRLQTLSKYFDAFRIDHILGFFRIWQVPLEHTQALLGFFNPALPVSIEEFKYRGITFDFNRFCNPYITEEILQRTFGKKSDLVKETFLEEDGIQHFFFKNEFRGQRKIVEFLELNPALKELESSLLELAANVLFIKEPGREGIFHPRIDMQKTTSYQFLDEYTRHKLDDLYNDYFYYRQNNFWKEQAMTKLPAIKKATNMLICGEDLGMIPASVPEVMDKLDLLTLEIQRMSKNPRTRFVKDWDVPYLSVCSPSTHDMSPIRAWWEESSKEEIFQFYKGELGLHGEPPEKCEPYVVNMIILKHLQYPSMWAVFPLQDLLGLSKLLSHPDPMKERINIPAIVPHYWRYRMHLNLESLLDAKGFNEHITRLLKTTGRF